MENVSENEPSEITIKRYELAETLCKEVIQEMMITGVENYVEGNYQIQKCYFYHKINGREISIFVDLQYEFGIMKIEFLLNVVAIGIIDSLERLLSNKTYRENIHPSVTKKLEAKNIDILTLFDLEEGEVEEAVRFQAKEILELFIKNIPFIAKASVVDALGSCITGHWQNFVKPQFKEHWAKLGLPDNFNLILNSDIEKARRSINDRQRWFLGDKQSLLHEGTIAGLAGEADILRQQYAKVRKRYKEAKSGYDISTRRPKENEWSEKWLDICIEEFPNLNFEIINPQNLTERAPYELVLIHFSDFYGYDEEYMKKKLAYSRSLKANINLKMKNGTS